MISMIKPHCLVVLALYDDGMGCTGKNQAKEVIYKFLFFFLNVLHAANALPAGCIKWINVFLMSCKGILS